MYWRPCLYSLLLCFITSLASASTTNELRVSPGLSLESYGESYSIPVLEGRQSFFKINAKKDFDKINIFAGGFIDKYEMDSLSAITKKGALLGSSFAFSKWLRVQYEYRYYKRTVEELSTNHNENRFGVISGYFQEVLLTGPLSLVSDSYMESFLIPEIMKNSPSFVVFSKLALRWKIYDRLYQDLYTEPYYSDSKNGQITQRLRELRMGLRIKYSFRQLNLGFQVYQNILPEDEYSSNELRNLIQLGGSF